MYKIFDLYLGVPPKDWSADMLVVKAKADSAQAKRECEIDAKRVKGTHPSLPLTSYVGSYADSLYGPAQVRLENGHLVLSMA